MLLFEGVFAVVVSAGDPPCDPGFNCNFDDESVGIAIVFWVGIFALAAFCIIFALAADFIKKQYWKHKYGSKDGVIHERNDLTQRGYVQSRERPVTVYRKGREVHVLHDCPICGRTNFFLQYHETLGRSPEETCRYRAEHPKQFTDPTP